MPARVDFPTIVQEALAVVGEVCDTAAARRPCAASLTGLIVAAHQPVRGINRDCAVTTDQACGHRWLTEVEWDATVLPDRRLAWLHQAPQTRASVRGGMARAQTLVTPAGTRLEAVGWCWEQAAPRHVRAHAAVSAHSVGPSSAPAPLAWRRFQPRASGPEQACKDHPPRGIALSAAALQRGLPGAGTLDSSGPSATVRKPMQRQRAGEVGALQLHRPVGYAGQEPPRQDVARQLPWEAQNPVRVGRPREWSCSQQRRMPEVDQPVRILRFGRARGDEEARTALGSPRLGWAGRRRVMG
jgi:hypothetical protein